MSGLVPLLFSANKTSMEASPNYGYHFGGHQNKDYNLLGSILGSPSFGKLPYSPPKKQM